MYSFQLITEKEKSCLTLLQNGKKTGIVEWPEGRDMGQRLFEAIQELLEKNGLKPQNITDFQVESTLPDHSTSRRIAETVAWVYSWGVQFSQKT